MRLGLLGSRGFPSTYSGYETFVRRFVPHAVSEGHEVVVYCRARRAGARAWRDQGAECRFTPGIDSKQPRGAAIGCADGRSHRGQPT